VCVCVCVRGFCTGRATMYFCAEPGSKKIFLLYVHEEGTGLTALSRATLRLLFSRLILGR